MSMGAPSSAICLIESCLKAPITTKPQVAKYGTSVRERQSKAWPGRFPSPSRLFYGASARPRRNKNLITAFLLRGRHPPFNTAPVADSQRSQDPLFKTSAREDSQRWRSRRKSIRRTAATIARRARPSRLRGNPKPARHHQRHCPGKSLASLFVAFLLAVAVALRR